MSINDGFARLIDKPLTYLFYKKLSVAQLDSLERAIKAEFGDDVPMPVINYIFG